MPSDLSGFGAGLRGHGGGYVGCWRLVVADVIFVSYGVVVMDEEWLMQRILGWLTWQLSWFEIWYFVQEVGSGSALDLCGYAGGVILIFVLPLW